MPTTWDGAGAAPNNNLVGRDMRLRDPEDGDFRPLPGSAAEGYGCQTFPPESPPRPLAAAVWPPAVPRTGGRIEVSGLLTGDTVWAADVVRVIGPVEVPRDGTLSIAAGTRVQFAGFHRLLVRGRLQAIGTALEPIVFEPAPGFEAEGWDGIDILNPPAGPPYSRLEHCVLSGAVARADGAGNPGPVIGGTHRPRNGGALSLIGGRVEVAACTFTGNRADFGGAIYVGYGASPILAGNLFTGNHAVWNGSALFSVYAYPRLLHNTIVGNICEAESNFHLCGAVENFNGKLELAGNILRDNTTPHYSGVQMVHEKAFYIAGNNIALFSGGQGNIDADPLFMGSGAHPWRLREGSPCVEAAPASPWAAALAGEDIAGAARLCGAQRDMGCYEYCADLSAAPATGRIGLVLHQNAPNPTPAGRGTRINFHLPTAAPVSLELFDARGRLVRRLLAAQMPPGGHEVLWNGQDTEGRRVAQGVYFYRLRSGDQERTRRLVILR